MTRVTFAATAPTDGPFLAKVGNADLVRGIARLLDQAIDALVAVVQAQVGTDTVEQLLPSLHFAAGGHAPIEIPASQRVGVTDLHVSLVTGPGTALAFEAPGVPQVVTLRATTYPWRGFVGWALPLLAVGALLVFWPISMARQERARAVVPVNS